MDVDRASPADVVNLAVDHGSVPMQIAALLSFDPADRPPAAALEAALGARLAGVPQLRRRLEATPLGCGRPVWVDDPGFALGRHLDVRALPAAEEDPGVTVAVELLLQRLPRDRPLWRARILTDTDRAAGVVVVMHHALADGIGGLAVLATLVDGAEGGDPAPGPPPRLPAPTVRELAADAWAERWRALAAMPAGVRRLRAALAELGGGPPRLAPRSSLLAPTTHRRRVDVVEVDLAPVVRRAHQVGATVNDLLTVAAARALGGLLESRGERLDELVVSVPVAGRPGTDASRLGNQVGVLPLAVPLLADRATQLRVVADQRARLGVAGPRGSSGTATSAAFRALAGLGLFEPFVNRQRLVHTFLTNLRGPSQPLFLAGARVARVVPVAATPGNVTVSFAVLSVAGRLVVAAVSDPGNVPEHRLLRDLLRAELDPATPR